MISRAELNQIRTIVRRSGVAADLEDALRPAGRGGRPRALSVEVYLTALVLTHLHAPTLLLTEVHKTLTERLTDKVQRDLGVLRGRRDRLTVGQVYYLTEAIAKAYRYTGRTPGLDTHERTRREGAFQDLLDRLVQATLPTDLPSTGHYAVDATAIDAAARPRTTVTADGNATGDRPDAREAGRPCADPDAAWGYRTRTVDNKTNVVFGYQLIGFTRLARPGQDGTAPLLIDRAVVVPANSSMSRPTIAALDRLTQDGTPAEEIVVDRGFSYGTAEKWADRLRARDVEQVLDLHKHDYGVTDHDGVKMIAGWPHCPSMPAELEDIRRPAQLHIGPLRAGATRAERADHARRTAEIELFHRRIAEREVYAFARHANGRRTSTGKGPVERFICPAQAGKVRCGNCPLSMLAPADLPTIVDPPDAAAGLAPAACTQVSISVPSTVSPKLRQKLRWGSPEWVASYGRRSRVEASFGLLKSVRAGRVRRGWIHLTGIVKTSLMLVVAVMATNIRTMRRWAAGATGTTDPAYKDPLPTARFEETEPDSKDPATGPPPAR